jgi:hypothetical protein
MSVSQRDNGPGGRLGFREISQRYLEPASQWAMAAGIVSICQPWSAFLHAYGVAIALVGLVGFIVFSHIKPNDGEE